MADLIRHSLHHDELQRAVLSGTAHGAHSPWRRVIVRKVALRHVVQTQAIWHTETTAVTRNYPTADAVVDELADVPFRNAHVELRSTTIEARVTKRGKLLVSRRSEANIQSLAHDRLRDRPIPEDAAFLEVLGVSHDGVVKPTAQRKYRQINEFIRILDSTLKGEPASTGALRVLDLGCGNAYLTFAIVHYLRENAVSCSVTGVDRDAEAISRNNQRTQRLGWQDQLRFAPSLIEQYVPTENPDLVIALHACDTATDDVLALAVTHDVRYLLASPCCHHDLQRQLRPRTMPTAFRDLARDGVLKEQLGDVLTDALRASMLRMVGYKVDVFAFVPVEHPPRNNLIRAIRTPGHADGNAETSVRALTGMFNVRPRLAKLLQNRLPQGLLSDADPEPTEPPTEMRSKA
ncbi:SAM-dependent methyltransferase [Micromonospora ureilytica]|uniref:class I SAM-dependent methyltransferase n=1 Tax=Micromonospora ureilytica TaxID=709868 RepID=UPI002E13B9B8|nr:SAM-dependent methyltransferase [Micromonospora ureilytica]